MGPFVPCTLHNFHSTCYNHCPHGCTSCNCQIITFTFLKIDFVVQTVTSPSVTISVLLSHILSSHDATTCMEKSKHFSYLLRKSIKSSSQDNWKVQILL